METTKTTAKLFGEYLDQNDYNSAKQLVSDICVYKLGDRTLQGKDEIVGLFESNKKEGQGKFDELVRGKNWVDQIGPLIYEVYFSDFLKHKDIAHNYRCKQRLIMNESKEIVEIIHVELPGERERLDAFYERVGLKS